jgi:ribonucleotide reductase alpha subunit
VLNAISYAETIATTNPCVTGDTKVTTDKGIMTIEEVDAI